MSPSCSYQIHHTCHATGDDRIRTARAPYNAPLHRHTKDVIESAFPPHSAKMAPPTHSLLLQCEVEIPLMSSRLWLRPTTRRSLQSKLPGFFPTKMAGLQSLFYFLSGRLPVGKLKRGHRPFERTQKHNHFNLNFFRHRCVEEIPGSWELRTCSHYLRQWVARMRPHPGLIHYLPHSFGRDLHLGSTTGRRGVNPGLYPPDAGLTKDSKMLAALELSPYAAPVGSVR